MKGIIIEDQIVISNIVKLIFKKVNVEVISSFVNSIDAINFISKSEVIDFIWLDLNLKDGNTGMKIAKLYLDKFPDGIIFLSSANSVTLEDDWKSRENTIIIGKPFISHELIDKLKILS